MAAPTTYPIKTISKLLMLTDRRVQQLVQEGHLPKGERGNYELVPVVQGYIKYLRDRAIGADVGEDGDDKARLLKAKADIAQYEAERLSGQSLAREDVDAAVVSAFARVRARMVGLPSKIAPMVAAEDNPAEIEGTIRKAVYDALRELSETSIADLRGDDSGMVEDTGPATGPDGEPVGGLAQET